MNKNSDRTLRSHPKDTLVQVSSKESYCHNILQRMGLEEAATAKLVESIHRIYNFNYINKGTTFELMNLIGELKTRSQKSTSVISSTFSEFSDGRFSRSWLSRLLRAYDLVVSFEIVPQIKDVERLCILARLPDEIKETAMISGKFHFFGESISIRNSKRNDLSQIVSALAQSGDASNFYRKKKYLEAIAKIEQAKKLLEKYESTRAISEELQFLVRDLEEKI